MNLNKHKTGILLGILSIFTAIVSAIIFLIVRGPNADVYFIINIFSTLSIIGIIFGVISSILFTRRLLGVAGVIMNLFILAYAFLLLLAMGIGEP